MQPSSQHLDNTPQPSGTSNRQRPAGSGSTQGHSRPTASVSHVTAGISQNTNMPTNTVQNPTSRVDSAREQHQPVSSTTTKPKKRNRHRKRRNRRQSFIASEDSGPIVSELSGGLARTNPEQLQERAAFYRGRNLSTTSLESEALLDHRDQPMMRPRRDSRLSQSFRPESYNRAGSHFGGVEGSSPGQQRSNFRYQQNLYDQGEIEEDEQEESRQITDRTPLITPLRTASPTRIGYGTDARSLYPSSARHRRPSHDTTYSPHAGSQEYDVNNPPSVPGSPKLGVTDMNYDDAMVTGIEFPQGSRSPDIRRNSVDVLRDAVINMEGGGTSTARQGDSRGSSPPTASPDGLRRRRTIAVSAEEDVCFPSEIAGDFQRQTHDLEPGERRRRRRREWPDLSVLEEWSREEKEERSLEYRVKKISEPVLVGGRLRPQYIGWRREEEDTPYRFTYFNEDFQSTIHAQTISELVQPGGGFRDLFIPDPPELEDSSDDEEDLISLHEAPSNSNSNANHNSQNNLSSNYPAPSVNNESSASRGTNTPVRDTRRESGYQSNNNNNRAETQTQTSNQQDANRDSKPKRYGPRPTWWLDVLCPTDAEMRVISKAFGIHALTAEDIMMQEAREKVELFRNYYFLNYRTFEQDPNSDNYLEPVNMYVVVFREGCLSFHFSQTPHPANVRRRIRQLRDYLILSSDWISYALIDDITDVFGPLIQTIENEVDEVDDTIMQMHNTVDDYPGNNSGGGGNTNNTNNDAQSTTSIAPGEMLRRVGEARKRVMGMYRLLSNKADVIKGFAKRCNEQWEVAPKSEIGLYLGDIQDHIMTMTSNLTHYETLLSRAHSNYLAQINILMNERQERTADVLGKLTVLGTIVLPMNIICGMWGMNVKVPGQEIDNLYWFWSITAGLVFFGVASFLIAKRVYRIV